MCTKSLYYERKVILLLPLIRKKGWTDHFAKNPHVYFLLSAHSSFSSGVVRTPHSTPLRSGPLAVSLCSPQHSVGSPSSPPKKTDLWSMSAKNHRILHRRGWMQLLRNRTCQIRRQEAIWSGSIQLNLARIRRRTSAETS
jgi:hypothetical protein